MSETVRIIVAIAIMAVLIALFFVSFLLNKKIPEPEGCRDLKKNCVGCGILSCGSNPANQPAKPKTEEKEEGKNNVV